MVRSPTYDNYSIVKLVAETQEYRLYICQKQGENNEKLFQIATDSNYNGSLDKFAYTLQRLTDKAEAIEEEYSHIKTDPKELLNYKLAFPQLCESSLHKEQGNRRVNILEFNCVEKINQLIPLSTLISKDKLKVDARTSVWIMGKLLKTLVFAHGCNCLVNNINLGNILIEPKLHYVIIFNWSLSEWKTQKLSQTEIREEIKKAASSVIKILGRSIDQILNEESHELNAYYQHLNNLAKHGDSSAFSAHANFYKLVDSLWKRKYHQFTTLPLSS